jgi:hypothetical protein
MPSVPPWRKMTWVLLIWTVVFAVLIIAGALLDPGVSEEEIEECMREGFIPPEECEETLEAEDEGIGFGVAPLFLLWLAGFLVLGAVWLLTRPRPGPTRRP